MTDRSDGFAIAFAPAVGPRRRVRYEPLSDGDWWRYEERFEGGTWHTEGRQRVRDVAVDATADALQEVVQA